MKISSNPLSDVTGDLKKNGQITAQRNSSDPIDNKNSINGRIRTITKKCVVTCEESTEHPTMDRSVDSIGTCSLDVEVSADLSGTIIPKTL